MGNVIIADLTNDFFPCNPQGNIQLKKQVYFGSGEKKIGGSV